MAQPPTAAAFRDALVKEGCRVVEVGDWETHNRNHKGSWGPVNGVMIHHTVTKGTASTVAICRDGYASLPGPLCHGVIAKDGRIHLVGYGRTNHAGGGDPDVLAAVVAENYGVRPPVPDVGNADGVDGNRHFFGFECENLGDGKDPWPPAQVDAIVRAAAAICRHFDWSAKSVIGHLEWSDDKSDPKGISGGMPGLRTQVQERLEHAAGWTKPAPAPAPTRPQPKTLEQRVADLEKSVAEILRRLP